MKAISLWEPWGTAIAVGLKKIETRHWSTSYRGALAIHCSKTQEHAEIIFADGVRDSFRKAGIESMSHLSFGCIVATCDLVDVLSTDALYATGRVWGIEELLGNYDAGRFGWLLANVKRLAKPVPFRGAQGFFNVPDEFLTP